MYDYVIVGAGSAGCVLANRLSRDPNVRVCVLEAGPKDNRPWVHWPIGTLFLLRSRKRNWQFNTEPQPALHNRELYWPRGRMLGGSSSMNGMLYIRGHPQDYDHWAELGNRGWGWDDVLPLFKREEFHEPGADDWHGQGGDLNVSELRYKNPVSEAFIAACQETGILRNDDFNGAEQEGAGFYQVTMRDGRRWSSARAHLGDEVVSRPNLTIITGAHATRVIFDGQRAIGVRYRQGKREHTATAEAEVILCGGAVQSPQLLMLSGVGPREELAPHDIRCVQELPGVGGNVQDHLDMMINMREKTRETFGLALSAVPKGLANMTRYTFRKQGMFTSNLAEAGAFVRSREDLDRPDLQYHLILAFLDDHGRKLHYGYGYSLHCCALHPHSRGRIGLRSADPTAAPRIDPRYLEDERDLDTLVAGFKIGREILNARALAPHSKGEAIPGEDVRTDDQIKDAIRGRAETIYHPVGSCKMGHDDRAVVDDRLRVHGVDGLRVADASIMPTLISGNTNATSIMIGEKCADMLMEDRVSRSGPQAVVAASA